MRPLRIVRLIMLVAAVAALPVLGVIAAYAAAYAQSVPAAYQPPHAQGRSVLHDPNLNGPAPMAGQNVVTTDGQRIGAVTGIQASPGGHVKAMLFKTDGFWGFGRRTLVVPAGRFAVTGQDVYINYSAGEIDRLSNNGAADSQG